MEVRHSRSMSDDANVDLVQSVTYERGTPPCKAVERCWPLTPTSPPSRSHISSMTKNCRQTTVRELIPHHGMSFTIRFHRLYSDDELLPLLQLPEQFPIRGRDRSQWSSLSGTLTL